MPSVIPNFSKPTLRRQLRSYRRSLSIAHQRRAALNLCQQFCRLPALKAAKTVALYIASDGEINPAPLLRRLQALGKAIYLPRLNCAASSMDFAHYKSGDKLVANCFGLLQPQAKASRIRLQYLDIVALPLVGFDKWGNRLGMGGGFYDRACKPSLRKSPVLIGLAYQGQLCLDLPADPWDVPLNWIATDQALMHFRRRAVQSFAASAFAD